MDAVTLLKSRRSIRKFTDQKVDRELMKEIVEIARWSPSWKNFQITRYTLIDNEELIKRIAKEGINDFIYNTRTLENAKGLAILSYVTGLSGKVDENSYATSKKAEWEVFDAGIACHGFCLAAHSKGVGTVIMGVFDDESVANIVGLPENEKVAALIVYGYQNGEPRATSRKEVEEILRFTD